MALDNKTKEFVAIGAAVGGNCIPCLQWHFNKSIEYGATIEELQEVIAMAKMVKEVPIKKINDMADLLLNRADNQ